MSIVDWAKSFVRAFKKKKEKPGQHKILSVRFERKRPAHDKPTELDLALSKFKKKGIRVLNFWRVPSGWEVKVMAKPVTVKNGR